MMIKDGDGVGGAGDDEDGDGGGGVGDNPGGLVQLAGPVFRVPLQEWWTVPAELYQLPGWSHQTVSPSLFLHLQIQIIAR